MASVLPGLSSYDNLDHYERIGGQLKKKESYHSRPAHALHREAGKYRRARVDLAAGG